MFHAGDLQSGISLAISQQRTVACFVTDDSEESKIWEEQWLRKPEVSGSLSSRAVVLRIQASSQEAGFLAAFCSIDKAPSLILIHNGQLKDNIDAGVGQDELSKRVLTALGEDGSVADDADALPPVDTPSGGIAEEQSTQSLRPESTRSPTDTTASQSTLQPSASHPDHQSTAPPSAARHSTPPPPSSAPNLQSTFPDRASQLEAKHQQQQEADKAKAAAAKARRGAEQTPGQPKTARTDYAAQQRQRLAEAKKERERVMAQIEADKQARKQRERERKEAEQATLTPLSADSTTQLHEQDTGASDPQRPTRRAGAAANANIQVRLFSGHTLRHTFPATATLARDVRAWVDEAAAHNAQTARPPPYIFKHILNPLPSRTLEVGEEGSSLADLDMLPSATLVLVPVQADTVDAFGGGGGVGVLGLAYGAASGAVGVVGSTVGWGLSTLGSIVGGVARAGGVMRVGARRSADDASSRAEGEQSAAQGLAVDGPSDRQDRREGSSKKRVRTLADRRVSEARDKHETWYNGNQTSYEPKDDPGDGPR